MDAKRLESIAMFGLGFTYLSGFLGGASIIAIFTWPQQTAASLIILALLGVASVVVFRRLNRPYLRILRLLDAAHDFRVQRRTYDRKIRQFDRIMELVEVDESIFDDFIEDAQQKFSRCFEQIGELKQGRLHAPDVVKFVARDLHSMKGGAGMLQLQMLSRLIHEAEDDLKGIGNERKDFDLADENRLVAAVRKAQSEVRSYSNLWQNIFHKATGSGLHEEQSSWLSRMIERSGGGKINFADIVWLQWEQDAGHSQAEKSSLGDYLALYQKLIDEMAIKTGKHLKSVNLNVEDFEFPKHIGSRINDMIVHCLKNSVDHGIEQPETRRVTGKKLEGEVSLAAMLDGESSLAISIHDDGKGIDPEAVTQKAISLGLVKPDDVKNWSDQQKINLVTYPGFSTAGIVTEYSGRGVGMDAVLSMAKDLGGTLSIDSHLGRGTTTKIMLPTTVLDSSLAYRITDVDKVMRGLVADYFDVFAAKEIEIFTFESPEPCYVFADSLVLHEALKNIFRCLLRYGLNSKKVQFDLRRMFGRRPLDSYEFFRIGLIEPERPDDNMVSLGQLPELSLINQGLASIHGTSFRFRNGRIELNIPSNMPLAHGGSKLVVLAENNEVLEAAKTYCDHILSHWPIEVARLDEMANYLKLPADQTGVIFLSDTGFDDLLKKHPSYLDQEHAAHLVVVGDVSNDSGLSEYPDEVLVMDEQAGPEQIHRVLEQCILRSFTKFAVGKSLKP